MTRRNIRMRRAYQKMRKVRQQASVRIAMAESEWITASLSDKDYYDAIIACDCPEIGNVGITDEGLDRLLDDLGL